MKETGTPQWNGEFGPVYASPDDDDWEKTNAERYNLLKDQLNIYQEAGSSWSIWLYKYACHLTSAPLLNPLT